MSRNTTIARPYAKALFLIAEKENAFASWSTMLAFAKAVAEDKAMQAFMHNPRFTALEVTQLFQEIGKDVFTSEANHFIAQLGKYKRWGLLPAIAAVFEQMRDAAERTVTVEIISAFAMNEKESARFAEALSQRMHAKIRLENSVDATILGGAIVRMGDWVIDGSVRGKLAKLGEAMGIY